MHEKRIDPDLLIRMLLVGYCLGIRSKRRLCEEVHLTLAYRWCCRLDLVDPVPSDTLKWDLCARCWTGLKTRSICIQNASSPPLIDRLAINCRAADTAYG